MKPDETLSLAPGAGLGLGRAMFADLLRDPSFPAALANAARDCLEATTPPRWDKGANGGKGEWVSGPDFRVRMQTLFGLLAQAEGDPVKRVIHQSISDGGVNPVSAMSDNPALIEAMQRAVDVARRKSGKRRVVDVGPVNAAGAVELDD